MSTEIQEWFDENCKQNPLDTAHTSRTTVQVRANLVKLTRNDLYLRPLMARSETLEVDREGPQRCSGRSTVNVRSTRTAG